MREREREKESCCYIWKKTSSRTSVSGKCVRIVGVASATCLRHIILTSAGHELLALYSLVLTRGVVSYAWHILGEYWESYRQLIDAAAVSESGHALPSHIPGHILHEDEFKGLDIEEDPEAESSHIGTSSSVEELGEVLLWQQLAQELQRQQDDVEIQSASEEEAAAAREITEEEEQVVSTTASALGQVCQLHDFPSILHIGKMICE